MADSAVYYTLSQVAELLGVHYETAARWVRTGRLPGVKLSRRKVLVPKESLDTFLARQPARSEPREEPAIGSPRRWLPLVGTLTALEAEALRASAQDFERVEGALTGGETGMTVVTFEGVVEAGQIRLRPEVHLPDETRVYVLVPDFQIEQTPRVSSPRLAHPEDAADFVMEVIEEAADAGV